MNIFKKSLILLICCTLWQSAYPLHQPVIKKGRYYNSQSDNYQHIDLWKALKVLAGKVVSPTAIKNKLFPQPYKPTFSSLMPTPTQCVPEASSQEPVITWVGHATFLIQIGGFNILTDPIFGPIKVGPITLAPRAIKPGIKRKDLPRIDAILISHNHSDHTDTDTLQYLQKKYNPTVFVPEGNHDLFASMGFTKIREQSWWQASTITNDVDAIQFTFVPAHHWSIRFSLDSYRRSLWGGWMITYGDKNIYFAGDTAYSSIFKDIAQQFPSIDVALLPIGPTGEEHEVSDVHEFHVDAKEAVDAFIDLKARCFIPMHYGTFWGKVSLENPLPVLHKTWQERQDVLSDKKLLVAQCGKSYQV